LENCLVSSGIPALDDVFQGLRLGDNVVWQVDTLDDYLYFVRPFSAQALADGRKLVYIRFAPHPAALKEQQGIEVAKVDPSPGFDYFSGEVHRIIEERGHEVFYVFDNLSALVEEWATDELLANFFQVTCPFLFELDTVTYFALTRGRHAHNAVARIRDTTQILADVYRVGGKMYVHPLKVWDRYSPQMFLPHLAEGESWTPVFQSGDAAAVSSTARKHPLRGASGSIAPWETVFRRLGQFRDTGPCDELTPELEALKQELCRMMIGMHPEFSKLAERYLTLEDLFTVRERVVGSGRIGGKAAGMLLARRILLTDAPEFADIDFGEILEAHDSFYIGSDVFFTFLVNNDLFRLRLNMTRNSRLSWEEFEEVERRFLEGKFPPAILEQFRNMLDYYGQAPIIVRSSSLLEDSFGNAFAGKYRSEFCANQGSPDERLEAFLNAVRLVYASALNPDALSYRRKRGLGESDEQMAILVQRVAGMPYGMSFFPTMAGVAFSKNLYAWSDRIDPDQGVIRLVFGLGTRAVDRVGSDYPRMIAVSNPQLRPEVGAKIVRYSQRKIDLLDLRENKLVSRLLLDILATKDYPNLHLFVSQMQDDHLADPITNRIDSPPEKLVLTFNNLIKRTNFVKILGAALSKLESAYGHPIDIEFTASITEEGKVRLNLLQCRPLWLAGSTGPVDVPDDIPAEKTLFRSSRMVNGGTIKDIRYILFIDPAAYSSASPDVKKAVGRVVGGINEHPSIIEGKVMMMGPGRWGSSNIELGVNVGYADIGNTSVLVEIAREEAGHVPEVSYGTHFFQDLVEAQIVYLPVYPDDPIAQFNHRFFDSASNVLADLLPQATEYAGLVQLIDVGAETGGALVQVVVNPQSREAICYIK